MGRTGIQGFLGLPGLGPRAGRQGTPLGGSRRRMVRAWPGGAFRRPRSQVRTIRRRLPPKGRPGRPSAPGLENPGKSRIQVLHISCSPNSFRYRGPGGFAEYWPGAGRGCEVQNCRQFSCGTWCMSPSPCCSGSSRSHRFHRKTDNMNSSHFHPRVPRGQIGSEIFPRAS